jgi:hypothetical protein
LTPPRSTLDFPVSHHPKIPEYCLFKRADIRGEPRNCQRARYDAPGTRTAARDFNPACRLWVMNGPKATSPLSPFDSQLRTLIAAAHRSHSCQKRAFAGYATASESLPLISPRQHWHLHQRYDCGLRRLHTLNAFTGRLKPLRASTPANSTSASVSTALNTLISTRICPSLA